MMILWDNYLDDSTIEVTSENTKQPVEQLTDAFLEDKFSALSDSTTLTITMPEDRYVGMIAYGFTNAVTVEDTLMVNPSATDTFIVTPSATDSLVVSQGSKVNLKDSSGTTLKSFVLDFSDYTNCVTLDISVKCRIIEITFKSSDIVYIGGLSIGNPLTFDAIVATPNIDDLLRGSVSKTLGGQVIGSRAPTLRQWDIGVPPVSNDVRLAMREMFATVGNYKPFYACIADEPAMYGTFTSGGKFSRRSYFKDFETSFTIEEAR